MIYLLLNKIRKTVYYYFKSLENQCNCYESKGNQTLSQQLPDGYLLIKVSELTQELCELIKNQSQIKVFEERFKSNHILYCITDGLTIVSYGWQTSEVSSFFVSEINRTIKFGSNTIVLYDFFTFPQFRRRGFYSLLLRIILSQISTSDRILIYALKDNFPSCHTITKVGFKYVGKISFLKNQI